LTGKRLKASERRASILAVAKVLFADGGYHGVSVDDIAKRLGVSPAVLYQHFDSKEALYEAVVSEITDKRESYVDAVLSGKDDFGTVLLMMTQIYVESVARDPDYLKMEMHNVLEGASAAQQFFDSRWKSFSDFIEVSMHELAPKKRVSGINPLVASLMYQGMVRETLYAKCIYLTPRYKDISLQDLTEQLVQFFLHAIDYRA
jgi:AcrR family transcriptional regulator